MQNHSFFSANDYRLVLEHEYEQRRKRRPSYTLRAFARDLGLTSTRLCAILKKRYGLSAETAQSIAERLNFTEEQSAYFVDLVEIQHSRSKVARKQAIQRIQKIKKVATYREGNEVRLLSRWFYPATAQLIAARSGKVTPDQIAKSLGIKISEANEAIEALISLGEIEKTKSGFAINQDFVVVKGITPQNTIRKFHKEVLEQIRDSIEREPIAKRKNLSTIFAFKKSEIERAREWMKDMHQKFMDEFGIDNDADSVYAVGFHLAPIEKAGESTK